MGQRRCKARIAQGEGGREEGRGIRIENAAVRRRGEEEEEEECDHDANFSVLMAER